MNFYFCETCGKRVTDIDLKQGQARNKKLKGVYCADCAVGVMTVEMDAIQLPVSPSTADMPAVQPPKQTSSRALAARTHPARSGDTTQPSAHVVAAPHGKKSSGMRGSASGPERTKIYIAASIAGVVAVLGLILAFSGGGTPPDSKKLVLKETAKSADSTPATQTAAPKTDAASAAKAPDLAPAPETNPVTVAPGGLLANAPANDGGDIRESYAKHKLDEAVGLYKDGKLSSEELRARYAELADVSYASTRAGKDAAERLRQIPPAPAVESAPAQTITEVQNTAPKYSPPGVGAAPPLIATAPIDPGKGVWWEGENTVENNFISHPWLADQLEKKNLSGGRYLNYLNDEDYLKSIRKALPAKLYARYEVNVPADGVYTLWVREYDPYCGVEWQFRWDGGAAFSVPPDYPFENKVEIGKDRNLVWRKYPDQKLSKGKHRFDLQAAIAGRHTVGGFDCFYLTTGTFKPDGPKKP